MLETPKKQPEATLEVPKTPLQLLTQLFEQNGYEDWVDEAAKKNLPYKVRILWGEEKYREQDDEPTEYSFETEAERLAFIRGVDQGVGYLDFDYVLPNEDGSWPELGSEEEEDEDVE
jgi:hypothetical protein